MGLRTFCLGASALAAVWTSVAAAQTAVATPPNPNAAGANTAAGGSGQNSNSAPVAEVVVTADRRTTNLQTTAIAATVLDQSALLKNGVVTVDQLQFVSPSLAVDNFGQGNDIDIRGIGKGEHNTQTGTGVVTYRDSVASFPGYFQEEPYYDVANVQVLRGPQGTFSGQNSTGGAIIVNTQDPKINGGYGGYLYGHYGNYNDTGLQGAINIPISDTLAARVAFNTDYRNSFYNINYANLDGGHAGDSDLMWGSTRFSLLWNPNTSLKVVWKTDYNYLDNGGYFGDALATPTGQLNPTNHLFNFSNNYETYAVDQFVRTGLRADYVLGDGITLRSVTAYQRGRTGWKGDIDGTDDVGATGTNYTISEASDETMWSQEFNVISPNRGPVTWILGAYYNHNQYGFPHNFDIGVPIGGFDEDFFGTNITHTYAGFGQVTFNLPAGFQLQAGARYSLWSTTNQTLYFVPEYGDLFNQAQDQRYHGNNVTGKVTLNWTPDSRNFLYAFVASGAKPGGLNTTLYAYPVQPIPAPFSQEYVVDYEVGWKSRFFDNHLRTQIGGYYNDFRHFQVSIPLPNNPIESVELNNPNTTVLYGFEASAQAVFGHLSVNTNLGLEHSSLGTFYADNGIPVATCDPNTGPASANCIDLKGHPQQYAPDVTFNVSAQYDYKLASGDTLTPSINYGYVSSQWGTVFDDRATGDYLAPRSILGASFAWTHGTFTTTLYGSNLTNDQYVSAILPPIRLAGYPRQFGISVLKTF